MTTTYRYRVRVEIMLEACKIEWNRCDETYAWHPIVYMRAIRVEPDFVGTVDRAVLAEGEVWLDADGTGIWNDQDAAELSVEPALYELCGLDEVIAAAVKAFATLPHPERPVDDRTQVG